MKPLKLRLSIEAKRDLEKIWLYTSIKWSRTQADRYYGLIVEHIHFLKSNPFTGKPAGHIREGYRASFVKNHVLFYRVEGNQTLEIVRILHQQVNMEAWLNSF